MKKYFLFLIITLIVSCSSIKEGEIYEKEFLPYHTEMTLMPIIISTGKSCVPILMPMWFNYPDAYKISFKKFSEKKNKFETRTVYTSKYVFDSSAIGNWYKICEDDCDEQPKIKMDKKE